MMNRPRAGEPTSVQKPGAIAAALAAIRALRPAAPPSPRRGLSPSLLGRPASEIDWRLTIIAALSFLAHFGVVGSIYSDWLDPLVDDGPTIEGLVDALKIVPAPFDRAPTPTAEGKVVVSTAPREQHGGPAPPSAVRATASPGSGSDHARLLAEAASRELAIISALGGSGNANNALRDGQAVSQLLDGVAADRLGVTSGHASGLRLGGSDGDLVAPGLHGGLLDVGRTTAGVPTGVGPGTTVKPPNGTTVIDDNLVTTGNVPNADHTVAGLKASYRRCYMRGLRNQSRRRGLGRAAREDWTERRGGVGGDEGRRSIG